MGLKGADLLRSKLLIMGDFAFDGIRADPRFVSLLKRLELGE